MLLIPHLYCEIETKCHGAFRIKTYLVFSWLFSLHCSEMFRIFSFILLLTGQILEHLRLLLEYVPDKSYQNVTDRKMLNQNSKKEQMSQKETQSPNKNLAKSKECVKTPQNNKVNTAQTKNSTLFNIHRSNVLHQRIHHSVGGNEVLQAVAHKPVNPSGTRAYVHKARKSPLLPSPH